VFVFPLCLLVPVLRYDLWAFESIVRRSASYHLKGGGPIDGLVRATAEMLRLPYVAVLRGGTVLSSYGETAAVVETWPVRQDGQEFGELAAAPRFGHASIDAVDREVLGSAARLVAGSLRAEALTADLRDARQELVTAREEERRRLRRDLHDGIGPMLTGLGLNLDAARADPDRAGEYLSNAKEASGEVIRSLREVVYALRPPSLDDLGFPGALRLQVGRVAGHLDVTVSVPAALPLPAAVEVAALRTAVEAVNNVVRHARATTVRVTVESTADLVVTVVDDGDSSAWGAPGVGLASMRERADELGGTLEAGPTSAGGRVRATFPLGWTS
jgi:signal transduction histidine kinase